MGSPRDRVEVVTSFLVRDGRILLLRRSDRVGTYRGKWAAVSGFLEGDAPVDRAVTEVREELGIGEAAVTLEAVGEPLPVDDEAAGRRWLVHPFRFALSADSEIRLDWEHIDMRWIDEEMLSSMDTVPGLRRAWELVRR